MSRPTLKEIVAAWVKGEVVQIRRIARLNSEWKDMPPFTHRVFFDTSHFEYRFKPKLREFWVMLDENGKLIGIFDSKSEADFIASYTLNHREVTHVREVQPE